jgi:subtilisin family serine protease
LSGAPPARATPITDVAPSTITATAELGQVADVAITVDIAGGTLQVYESEPPSPPGLAPAAARAPGPTSIPLPQQRERIDPALLQQARSADTGELSFLVYLSEQPDLAAAYAIRGWDARGRFVYETLRDHAERTQAGLRAQLASAGVSYRPLWIVNAVAVHGGDAALVQALAARQEVALLQANRTLALPEPQVGEQADSDCAPDAAGVCWQLREVNVPRAWSEFGTRGRGITVATLDTGALYTHPQLVQQYRGYRGAGSFDHNYNWFDPDYRLREPADAQGHGTHTLGSIVGRGGGGQLAFGVAPEATWIAAQGCEGKSCEADELIAAAQWLLAPTDLDGNNPRPELRPQIINNSWGGIPSNKTSDWYTGYTAAWRASGMLPIFAAGNRQDADCMSLDPPGEYADVIAVGATARDGLIARFSGRGPTADGRLKPDLSAPGQGVVSAYIGDTSSGTTAVLDGTSMAAPHVTGVAALLYAANPNLIGDYEATYRLLTGTARRATMQGSGDCGLGPEGANQIYGYGVVDAYAALADVDVPWIEVGNPRPSVVGGQAQIQLRLDARRVPQPGAYEARLLLSDGNNGAAPVVVPVVFNVLGTPGQQLVSGSVRDDESGEALRAMISVEYLDLGVPGARLSSEGGYQLQLPAGSYRVTVRAAGYLEQSRTISVGESPHEENFALRSERPRLSLSLQSAPPELSFLGQAQSSLVLTNTGAQPLSYTLAVADDVYGVWRSDERPDKQSPWVDLPADAADIAALMKNNSAITQPIDLGFYFPFYDRVFTGTFVTEDGMLTFFRPPQQLKLQGTCPPIDEQIFFLLMPFRADLDFARGGKLRHGREPNSLGYLISYENVPALQGTQRYSFQTALYPDGTIIFRYKHVVPLPGPVGVGAQRSPLTYQRVACGVQAPLSDGLSIRLQPRPLPSGWISLPAPSGLIPPGGRVAVPVQTRWVHAYDDEGYMGAVEIATNDPRSMLTSVPVAVRPTRAPVELQMLLLGRRR